MGKVIHWELCKRMKFDHITKEYMDKTESVWENEMHKILWHFETKTNYLIPTRRPDLNVNFQGKKTWHLVNTVPADHRVKIKVNKTIDKYWELARELKKKKAAEHEGDGDTDWDWWSWNCSQRFEKKTGGNGNERKNQDHLDHSSVRIGQNTRKTTSPQLGRECEPF